jgi:succinate dehydrogenase / fumarate reductase iron-sulfur subunit
MARGKVTPTKALLHQHKAPKSVKQIFKEIEGRGERYELNLYIVGFEEEDTPPAPDSHEPTPAATEAEAISESESG